MDGIAIAPGVILTPGSLTGETSVGMLARITGTHPRYGLARDFLNRSGPPWGWVLTARGLYEWRPRSDDRDGARFFLIEGAFRKRARLVETAEAYELAARMGTRG